MEAVCIEFFFSAVFPGHVQVSGCAICVTIYGGGYRGVHFHGGAESNAIAFSFYSYLFLYCTLRATLTCIPLGRPSPTPVLQLAATRREQRCAQTFLIVINKPDESPSPM